MPPAKTAPPPVASEEPEGSEDALDGDVGSLLGQGMREESAIARAARENRGSEPAADDAGDGDGEEEEPQPATGDEADDEADGEDDDSEELLPPADEEPDETVDTTPTDEGDSATPAPAGDESTSASVDAWASRLLTTGQYQRILSEVPRSFRTRVIEATVNQAAELGMTYGAQQASERLVAEAQRQVEEAHRRGIDLGAAQERDRIIQEAEYAEIEQMAKESPEEYAALSESDPDKVERYLQRKKNGGKQPSAAQLTWAQKMEQDFYREERVSPEEKRVLAAWAQESARQGGIRYPESRQGLHQLETDLQAIRSAGRQQQAPSTNGNGAKPGASDDAAARAAAARRASAQALKNTPKPDVGSKTSDAPLPDDVETLLRQGFRQDAKAARAAR